VLLYSKRNVDTSHIALQKKGITIWFKDKRGLTMCLQSRRELSYGNMTEKNQSYDYKKKVI
jgi:hypothetical protein